MVLLEDRLHAAGVVTVTRPPAPPLAEALARALLAAGIDVIEITFRTAGAPAAIDRIRTTVPEMLVGAGTVLTRAQARQATDAGAEFVVAPGSSAGVIEAVLDDGTAMIPGVATPSEIEANLARGLTLLKLFPAESSAVSRWSGPCMAHIPMCASCQRAESGRPIWPPISPNPTSSHAAGRG